MLLSQRRKIAIYCLVASGFGCTTATKEKSTPDGAAAVSEAEQMKIDEMNAEIEVGRNMAGRILQVFGTYGKEDLVRYINEVGNYVASNGKHPERSYMFEVLNSDRINAFACPGGYILVTVGAIRMAENEAELAAILGHEATHVGNRHMFNTLKNMKKEELDKAAKEGDELSRMPETMQNRARPKPEENAFGSLVARYLTNASGTGLNVLTAASAGMGLILQKGIDKDLEYEADREGTKMAIQSGYDPKGFVVYLGRLQRRRSELQLKDLEGTHPKVEDRRKAIAKLLLDMKSDEIVGALGKERFEKFAGNLPILKRKKDRG